MCCAPLSTFTVVILILGVLLYEYGILDAIFSGRKKSVSIAVKKQHRSIVYWLSCKQSGKSWREFGQLFMTNREG